MPFCHHAFKRHRTSTLTMASEEGSRPYGGFEDDVVNATSVKVPPGRKASLGSIIGFVLASIFFLLFIISISQLSGLINAMILASFSIFGWDPIITSLFMAGIFLFLTVTIYLLARRGREAASKVEAGLNLMFDVPPTRYFDLSDVPSANIIRELVGSNNPRSRDRGRGCTMAADDEGDGFVIRCDTIPSTDAMDALKQGRIDRMESTQKLIILVVFGGFGILLAVFTILGLMSGVTMWVLWLIYLVTFFYAMLELRVLKMWGVLLTWTIVNVFFTFTISDPAFLWTLWGALIAVGILVAVFYLLSKEFCKRKESGICDFL